VLSLAVLIGLNVVGIDLTALAVFSGAIGIGIGFGMQKVFGNLVSGFILLMDHSIKPGDVIAIGETYGWVNKLGARYVSILTRDGKEHLIPNESLITQQVELVLLWTIISGYMFQYRYRLIPIST
jgi:small-conductance mechanosensitive channel